MAESPYKISRWPEKERPRERLLQQGAQYLTEAELLGILIGKGTRKKTAIDLARELLDRYESLENLFSRSPSELMKVKGIGSAKAATLSAAFQLVRRIQAKKTTNRSTFEPIHIQAILGCKRPLSPVDERFEEGGLQDSSPQPRQSVD